MATEDRIIKLVDGENTDIQATVDELVSANALVVEVVDGNGDQITSFGGGTQYTDGAVAPAHPVGPTITFDDGGTMTAVSDADPLPVSATIDTTGLATSAKQDTIIGHIDGVETLLTAIDGHVDQIEGYTDGIETLLTAIDGHVDGLETSNSAIQTSVELIDNAISGAGFNITQQGGVAVSLNTGVRDAGTQRVTIATNDVVPVSQSGTWDEVGINDSGNSITVDNAQLSVVGSGTEATAMRVTLATDSTGLVSVDDNGASLSVDWNGTQPVTGNGNATGALRVSLANNSTGVLATVTDVTTLTTLTGSSIAHDGVDSGNPHKIGFKAYSPDGTTPGVVAELDRTDAKSDLNGRLFVNKVHPQNFSYHDDDAAAVTTDGTAAADPGDGFAVFITDIIFSIGAATASSIFLEEGSTKILGPYYLEAVAGRSMHLKFETPKRCTASTAILVTNTGSILFSIDILGFVAAV